MLQRALWVARFYYMAYFAALGAIVPFFNVYLQQRGMSGPQIGLIASFPPFVGLVANPFWGLVADRWQVHRRVLATCALVAGVASVGFIWVNQLWSILIVICVVNFFRAPISSILDTTVMGIIAANPNVDYARQRVFGSFGWIMASLSVGYMVGNISINTIFVLHAVLLALVCALLSMRLPVQRSGGRVDLRAGLRTLLKLPAYRGLLIMMMLFGAASSANLNFGALNILRLGGTAALIGYANAASAVLEIPTMFLNERWSRRVSRRATIIIALLGFFVTLGMVGTATSPTIIPFYLALFGIFFALMWPAVVAYVYTMAPEGLTASAQTIAQAAHGGLGWALGSVLSGFLWAWQPAAPFFAAAAMALLGAGVFAYSTRSKTA